MSFPSCRLGLQMPQPPFKNEVFRPYLRKYVLVFFEEILIYSRNEQDHVHHVDTGLATLSNFLKVNVKKGCFGVPRVAYLGHVISTLEVEVDQE